jgi:hypothetical protein
VDVTRKLVGFVGGVRSLAAKTGKMPETAKNTKSSVMILAMRKFRVFLIIVLSPFLSSSAEIPGRNSTV